MTRENEIKDGWSEIKSSLGESSNRDDETPKQAWDTGIRCGFQLGVLWADAHPHWISVEEELPNEGEMVLIFQPDGVFQFTTAFFTNIALWEKLGITHWMPLPQPPEHFADASKMVEKGGSQ